MPLESPIAGIDFETSGYCNGHKFVAVEIGLSVLRPSGVLEVLANTRLSGATKISYHAAKTHGIYLRDCYGKPQLDALWPRLRPLAGIVPLCGHATGTEKKILREKFPLTEFVWIDTLKVSRRIFPQCPSHKLASVCQYLGLLSRLQAFHPRGRWHSALYDATASALIVEEVLRRNPRMSVDDLIHGRF